MSKKKINKAKQLINKLKLDHCIGRAIKTHRLYPLDAKIADREYRQFLLLIWIKHSKHESTLIIPTNRAAAIWKEHRRDYVLYERFCTKLCGGQVSYQSGLKVGSQKLREAISHTKLLQHDLETVGFVNNYAQHWNSTGKQFAATKFREKGSDFALSGSIGTLVKR